MGVGSGYGLRRKIAHHPSYVRAGYGHRGTQRIFREFAEDGVDEGGGGGFAGAFYQFDAFVEGGAVRDTVEIEELIEAKAKGNQDFWVELL
jgi:hypothetical protein